MIKFWAVFDKIWVKLKSVNFKRRPCFSFSISVQGTDVVKRQQLRSGSKTTISIPWLFFTLTYMDFFSQNLATSKKIQFTVNLYNVRNWCVVVIQGVQKVPGLLFIDLIKK